MTNRPPPTEPNPAAPEPVSRDWLSEELAEIRLLMVETTVDLKAIRSELDAFSDRMATLSRQQAATLKLLIDEDEPATPARPPHL